jgi:hypothetical protein
VRLAGTAVTSICRLDLYGAWRLLTCFESPHRCILLLVAEHTRTENPYRREPTYFVLASLLDEPLHGYAIMQRTGDALTMTSVLRRPKPLQVTHIGIMPVILVKLIMACSGNGAPLLRRWC